MDIYGFDLKMFICLLTGFLVTVITVPVLIPYLKKLKFGQQILEEGPKWHEKKSGTPTMGGISFIFGATVAMVVALAADFDIKLLTITLVSLGFGVIGFCDDYIKVVKKRNLGLTASQKYIMQAVLSVIYIIVLKETGNLSSEIIIPFTDIVLTMPWWLYIPFILVVITGTVNAVNLTDGLDGLATSVTIVSSLFFALAAVVLGYTKSAYFAFAVVGGLVAFFLFNKHPARVFMGDTGSLYLGGVLSVLAVGMKLPLVLIIAGFVFFFETLSVIIQVTSFRLTGKRVFKMSPVHHHFEMCGWNENKIVTVFCATQLVLAVVAYLSIM